MASFHKGVASIYSHEASCYCFLMRNSSILVMGISLLLPIFVEAHPGMVDKNGCHVCTNSCENRYHMKKGEYHCHLGEDRMKNYSYADMKKLKKSSSSKASVANVQRSKTGVRPRN